MNARLRTERLSSPRRRAPVTAKHQPRPRPADGVGQVAGADAAAPIALARQRQDRVGPEPHAAVDLAGQMDAEERQRRVRHRVDQALDERGPLRPQLPVLAAERNDPGLGSLAGRAREAVGLQAGADDHPIGLQRARRRDSSTSRRRQLPGPVRRRYRSGSDRRPPAPRRRARTRPRRSRRSRSPASAARRSPRSAGSTSASSPWLEPAQAGHAVCLGALAEPAQRLEFVRLGRGDDLPAGVIRESVGGAVVTQESDSSPA